MRLWFLMASQRYVEAEVNGMFVAKGNSYEGKAGLVSAERKNK